MITKEEYGLLKHYHTTGYRWIARDENEELCVCETKPIKLTCSWLNFNIHERFDTVCDDDHLFQYIKWDDEEPTKILDLMQDYESHQIITVERVKVTIPQFVADWIEECKPIYNLRRLFSTTHMPDSVKDWTSGDDDNCNLMALAWIYGYEVEQEKEKEKLYLVALPNYQRLSKIDDTIKFMDIDEWFVKDLKTQLTQAEIESVDPILMQIAEEVE